MYINKNGQQSGPYEDHVVIDQLRNGMLSPDDQAIRHGETSWQRLGDMFPDARPTTPATASPVGFAESPPATIAEPSAKGGCRKIFGWLLLVLGIVMLLGGIGTSIVNRTLDHPLCQQADRRYQEMKEAEQEVNASKGTPRQASAIEKLREKTSYLEISTRACGDMTDYYRWWFIALLAIAAFGFILAIVGFFIRRV